MESNSNIIKDKVKVAYYNSSGIARNVDSTPPENCTSTARTPLSLEIFLMLATAKVHYAVVYCTVSGKPLSQKFSRA